MSSSWPTTVGARPSDSSSIMSRRGFPMNAMPSVSICCWPPDRLPAGSSSRSREDGEELEHLLRRLASRARRAAVQPARELQVLAHGQRREHALAARHHASRRGPRSRRAACRVMSRPSKMIAPLARLDEAGDRLEQRRLAGAVGAEQRDDLALVDLEVDVEEHLHAVVVHVDAAARAGASPALAALVERLLTRAAADVHTRRMSARRLATRRRRDERADEEDRRRRAAAPRGCPRSRRRRR